MGIMTLFSLRGRSDLSFYDKIATQHLALVQPHARAHDGAHDGAGSFLGGEVRHA